MMLGVSLGENHILQPSSMRTFIVIFLSRRRQWKVTNDKHCVLYPLRAYEDRVHLFFECNFSTRIWNYLQIDWTGGNGDLQDIVAATRRSFPHPFFMEVMITASWNIWIIRNAFIFRNEKPTFRKWKCNFVHDSHLLKHRIKAKHLDRYMGWLSSLP
uniref:Uncharacterized protein n=1 Tax=Avena sativa TaxID=4498 RepID=A0ACD5TXX0_AVESA